MKGCKHHITVNLIGLVLKCYVGTANQADVKAALWTLMWVLEQYERIQKILADKGYRDDIGADLGAVSGVPIELSKPEGKVFTVKAKRWIVERNWT